MIRPSTVAFTFLSLIQVLLVVGGWRYYARILCDLQPQWQAVLTSRPVSFLGFIIGVVFVLLPLYSRSWRIENKPH